ncbi:MAG TPA: MarR family transcriptional regulator [Alphaproteobacteria bacterium]|jgi:DNA-binding MarR family transcriptional regulator
MADLPSRVNPLFLREEVLRQGIELLLHAQRDFAAEADPLLQRHGLGRAHHRALYFVGRYPSISVSELLALLGITKQSLSRVLRDLTERRLIAVRPGTSDRRQRRLTLTEEGGALEAQLTEGQSRRLARAYRQAGAEAVEGFRKVLLGLIDESRRERAVSHLPPTSTQG